MPVYSVALTSNAIYAAGDTLLYAASLTDNLVDYSYWSTLPLPKRGQIQGVATAGGELYLLQGNTCYRKVGYQWQAVDNQSYKVLNVIDGAIYPAQYQAASCDGIWLAAGEHGMLRQMATGEQIAYHLDGQYALSAELRSGSVVYVARRTMGYTKQQPGQRDALRWQYMA